MIASIVHFGTLNETQREHQDRNYQERFGPALESQPGYVMAALLENEAGERTVFGIWESEAAMIEATKRANALPLLPGQRGEDIPGPVGHETWRVVRAKGIGARSD